MQVIEIGHHLTNVVSIEKDMLPTPNYINNNKNNTKNNLNNIIKTNKQNNTNNNTNTNNNPSSNIQPPPTSISNLNNKNREDTLNTPLFNYRIIYGSNVGELITVLPTTTKDTTQPQITKIKFHSESISCFLVIPSLCLLVSASHDNTLLIWNCAQNRLEVSTKQIELYSSYGLPTVSRMSTVGESKFATLSADNVIRVWCLRGFELLVSFRESVYKGIRLVNFCYSCLSGEIVCGYEDRTLSYVKVDEEKMDKGKFTFLLILLFFPLFMLFSLFLLACTGFYWFV